MKRLIIILVLMAMLCVAVCAINDGAFSFTNRGSCEIDTSDKNVNISYGDLTEEEIGIVERLLTEYEKYKNGEVDKVKIEHDKIITRESYDRLASFFSIYAANYTYLDDLLDVTGSNGQKAYASLNVKLFDKCVEDKERLCIELDLVLSTFTDGTDQHKLYQIANWLADNFEYDISACDAPYAFDNKIANCNGFAILFKMMASRLGIQCDICTGFVGKAYHAWNVVTLNNGETRFYDVCFYNSTPSKMYLHNKLPLRFEYGINNYWYEPTRIMDVVIEWLETRAQYWEIIGRLVEDTFGVV